MHADMILQHITGNQAGWHMHTNAAKEIIHLRGGIDGLNLNMLLRIVMFWYGSQTLSYVVHSKLLTWLS
jgi:hypothetical protein